MELEGKTVVAYLTPEGFAQLNFLVGLDTEDTGAAGFVMNTDRFGMWMSLAGDRWGRTLIVPWHYLRAIEVEPESEPGREIRGKIGFQG